MEERELVVVHHRFTQVAVEVRGAEEGLECWIFENTLRQDNTFREKLWRMKAHSLKEILNKAQPFTRKGPKQAPILNTYQM